MATLANRGVRRELVVDPDSAAAPLSSAPQTAAGGFGKRLLSAEASYLVLDMLRDVTRPQGTPGSPRQSGRPLAWKTGTSFGFRDAWSIGVIGNHVLTVWVGNFDGSANPALVGREAAAPLFFAIADSLAAETRRNVWWAAGEDVGAVAAAPQSKSVSRCARRRCAHPVLVRQRPLRRPRPAAGEGYFWEPRPGRFSVRVVDDLGRAAMVAIRVANAAPVHGFLADRVPAHRIGGTTHGTH